MVWGGIWLGPVLVLLLLLGPDHVYSKIALYFSKLATVTFGGAYAVLTYMAQEAVAHYGLSYFSAPLLLRTGWFGQSVQKQLTEAGVKARYLEGGLEAFLRQP